MNSPADVNDFDDNKAGTAVPTVAETMASRYYSPGILIWSHFPEHDPEKWVPVFGKDHAPTIS
jgi:hypothetical protein